MRKLCLLTLALFVAAASSADTAENILTSSGVKGGLVVVIGCDDAELLAELRANDSYTVQGLDTDPKKVEKARKYLREKGVYGPVSVMEFDGEKLPYANNLVNLVVVSSSAIPARSATHSVAGGRIPQSEIERVLAPLGVALIEKSPGWKRIVKPWPQEIDEWTHYLHDASGNAVAHDSVVGPPRHLQWVGGQAWDRYHDTLPNMSALVSARGRIFSIEDHGPIASMEHPAQWFLIARDAFNGIVLWQKDISSWASHRLFWQAGPSQITRRLVAVDDRVYVTLGYNEPVLCLDAATGKTLKTYQGTERTREIIHANGMLLLAVGNKEMDGIVSTDMPPLDTKRIDIQGWKSARLTPKRAPHIDHVLVALNDETGAVAWKKDVAEYFPLTLAAYKDRVCFQNGQDIVYVEFETGTELWRTEMGQQPPQLTNKIWRSQDQVAPTLVMYDDVVLYGDSLNVHALSGVDGKKLWSAPNSYTCFSPPDIFVADGLVWVSTLIKRGSSPFTEGRDPLTGEVKRSFEKGKQIGNKLGQSSHIRCYRSKATDKYVVGAGEGGPQFHSLDTGVYTRDDWIRGTCQYGMMPANGLLYAPPNPCACFVGGKLNGFLALAPEGEKDAEDETAYHLERGPAYSEAAQLAAGMADADAGDWPTYRHDPSRSGATAAAIPGKLRTVWKANPGRDLSSLVVAGGRVYVASVDGCTVHALDAGNGAVKWSYTVAGRVDSPPTVYQGLVLFGSADGWVYCLRASDGELAWRLRGAPRERQVASHGRLESAWPIHGSVLLVEGGAAYAAAGRSSFIGGGIHMVKLDVGSGNILVQKTLSGTESKIQNYERDSKIANREHLEKMACLPDILSGNGTSVFMRQAKLSADDLEYMETSKHLYSTAGFLDDTWFQRNFWTVAGSEGTLPLGSPGFNWKNAASAVPHGRILVMDDSSIYGFGRKGEEPLDIQVNNQLWRMARNVKETAENDTEGKPKKSVQESRLAYTWSQTMPIQVHAMVLAGDILFVAGPRGNYRDLEALQGKKGAALLAVSAADGKTVGEYDLEAPPVFDGMAAAGGRLYIPLKNGTVVCLGE